MTHPGAADFEPIVSRSATRERIRNALRLFIGRGRRYSVKQVANGTGVKDRAIECAMVHPDNVEWRGLKDYEILSVAAFLGPAFTSEIIALADQGAFHLPDDNDTPPGKLVADLSEDTARVTRAVADNDFTPGSPNMREVGKRFMDTGAQLARVKVAA